MAGRKPCNEGLLISELITNNKVSLTVSHKTAHKYINKYKLMDEDKRVNHFIKCLKVRLEELE